MCLAVPGKIVSICEDGDITRMARVRFGGIVKDVSLAYTPEARVGDYAIVHVGFAIGIVDEVEAQQTLGYLEKIGELEVGA